MVTKIGKKPGPSSGHLNRALWADSVSIFDLSFRYWIPLEAIWSEGDESNYSREVIRPKKMWSDLKKRAHQYNPNTSNC